jgi:murein DD-endopeptidase MepM/ murein hydrolase activator NlpD
MTEQKKDKNRSSRLFNIISWGITGLIVISLLAYAIPRYQSPQVPAATLLPTAAATEQPGEIPLPDISGFAGKISAIVRQASINTNIPERPRYEVIDHEVVKGDSLFAIAEEYSIKPDSLLWANFDVLKDNPDSLRLGMDLKIPPTNGVYYQWQEGDTLDSVATRFKAQKEDIINWPGNNVDLVDPEPKPSSYVMIPGGSREFVQWLIPTIARGSSGTAAVGGGSCGGGPIGSTAFVWPADNHSLSGNDFWPGHLGIDIGAGEGAPVYAADSGVVTAAAGGYNYGYGNYIMIDHGNGYVTLYAHLSQINVVRCQGVYAGNLIGLAGNTGNSFGAHLHFEVRLNGGFINPWYVLP